MIGRGAIITPRGAIAAAITARAAITTTITARTAIAPAIAAWTSITTAITARAAITAWAITARLARRAGIFQLSPGFLIDHAHRQAHLAALIDLEHLNLDRLAFGHDVGWLLDALVAHFRNVDQSVLAAHEIHEGAEIDDGDNLAVVDFADFGFLDDAQDPGLGGLDLRRIGRADLDQALVVDVDLGAGFSDDLTDHLTASTDHFTDLRFVDLQAFDPRRMGR